MGVKRGYKQTEVGVIPEGWESVEIGPAIDLVTGFPFPSRGYARTGVRLLRGSNVKRAVTDWSGDNTEYWPAITPDIRKYVLKAGDIVVAMDGSLVGRSFAMLSEDDVPTLLLQRVARIRAKAMAQTFLKAWICSQRFTDHCDAVKTVTAIPHISPADIKSFKVALPPTKTEQEAIAEALSDADALVESLEQLIAKKRQLKQGAMQELLTGKRRLPGFEVKRGYKQTEVGVIPEDWEVSRLGAHATFKTGPFGSALHQSDYTAGGIPVINPMQIVDGRIEPTPSMAITEMAAGKLAEFRLSVGNVVIGRRGEMGRCAVVGSEENGWLCGTGSMIIRTSLDARFIQALLSSPPAVAAIESASVGSTMINLNQGTLGQLRIARPPTKAEQEAIVAILTDMDAEIAALEAKLTKARQLKQGMMQELLTGRIRLV